MTHRHKIRGWPIRFSPTNVRLAGAVVVMLLGVGGGIQGCVSSPSAGLPAYGTFGQAQLFGDMGQHSMTITTRSPEAQRYFNEGLAWMYSFNHDEAVQSFAKAATIDPSCAMAWWGVAYAQGPNYNDPGMPPARSQAAWDALVKARAALDDETPKERALIEALGARYANPAPDDRKPLDAAFAQAMAKVWAEYPNDSDVGVFYAESMMVRFPWRLYDSQGRPALVETATIVATLERVMALEPSNPGANHLYIHAVEPSRDKRRAIPAADRLRDLVPASGHMNHMPSHIYAQVGMWEASIEQNAKATLRDEAYRKKAPNQMIQNGYMMHNAHMLAFSAMMVGQEERAMKAAKSMWTQVPIEKMRAFAPYFDSVMCSIYDVQKRFGRWDALLAEPPPPEFLPITTAVWHAHRAIAFAAKHDFDNAEVEHIAFRQAMQAIPHRSPMYGTSVKFLLVSELFIKGEIALQQSRWDDAALALTDAAEIEDALGYGEPPMWLQPVRHTLGAVYMKAGRAEKAEEVYRADLAKWPGNGWSLYGLSEALERQGKTDEAQQVRAQFDRVWKGAEEPLQTSCKCIKSL